jgi:hypothetical protein
VTDGARVDRAVALLDRWLDGMRGADGYTGPVVHWWRDSLTYCGPGLDWRYEGIIDGYLTLFDRTSDVRFLAKAKRAGDDLVRGQLPDGTFKNSSFERNPRPGGTPHEAAVDAGLLRLASTLRLAADGDWECYAEAAKRNVDQVLIRRLWHAGRFNDGPDWFVPNKACTIIETLCLLSNLSGKEDYVARYVRPTADAVLAHQMSLSGPLRGAIAQGSRGKTVIEQYFPYYVARSIPGLCAAYAAVRDERYADAALQAASFVMRWQDQDGGWPQVVYSARRMNRYPRWVAGAGEVLTALEALKPYGFSANTGPIVSWILDGQLPSGAIRTAVGFGLRVSQRGSTASPDLRDVLPVVGWTDKAFRSLARLGSTVVSTEPFRGGEIECSWRGQAVDYREDPAGFSVTRRGSNFYRWDKHRRWAEWGAGDQDDGE